MSVIGLVLIGWLMAALAMTGLWWVQLKTADAGIVDVAWAIGVGLLAVGFAVWLPGLPARKWMVIAVVSVWSARLGTHVWQRLRKMPADGRYAALRAHWGSDFAKKIFGFYQLQAIGVVLFSLPILGALLNPGPLHWLDFVGFAIGLLSIVGESWADWQLTRFRQQPENRGRVCRVGWWKFSRHPNYFFEWLHWWAYVCFAATDIPRGWLTALGPLAMWFTITRVTGIPPTEAQALRSRGAAYSEYQQTTNAFFPWLPRRLTKQLSSAKPLPEPSSQNHDDH